MGHQLKLRFKKFIITIILLLAVCAVPGWFYRYKINHFLCMRVVRHIEQKSGSDIIYTSIKADAHSMSARNVMITAKDFVMTAETVEIEYDWAILWRSSKIDYLKDISINDFAVTLGKDLSGKPKPDKDEDDEKKQRKIKLLLSEILGHFNSLVHLNNGSFTFNTGGTDNTIDILQATLSRSPVDNSLLFNLKTASGGLVPDSSIDGTFQPSIPGFFKASASVNMFFYANRWHWQTIAIDGKWDIEGSLSLGLQASAGDKARVSASYQTNFLEEDLSVLDVNASNITLTRLPTANQVYLSDSLMDVLGKRADKILNRNQISGTFGTDISVVWDPLSEKVQYELTVDVNAADMTYSSFPYSLKAVSGYVMIDNSRLKVDLKTTSGNMIDVKVSAGLGEQDDIDVRVTSPFLPADNKLYQAIGEAGQVAWLSFAPTGNVAIDYHLFGTSDDDNFQLEIIPLGGSICYEEFIYPLYGLSGKLIIADDKILLENMSGSHGKGKVVLNGAINDPGTSDMKISLNFDCSDVAIDKLLFDALPADVRENLDDIDIDNGVSSMNVKVTSAGRGRLAYIVDMDASANALTYKPVNITFDKARVKALFEDNNVVIKSLNGFVNGQAVELKGTVAADPNSARMSYSIDFNAQDALFEKLAMVFEDDVPKAARLTGKTDITGHIRQLTGGNDGFGVSVKCRSSVFELVEQGIRLDDFNGTIDIDKSSVAYDITAHIADSESCKVASKGRLDAANLANGTMNVQINGAKTSDAFLPDELDLLPGGGIDLTLDNLSMTDGNLLCDKATMIFSNLGIEGGVIDRFNGNVYGALSFSEEKGLSVSNARLNVDNGRILGRLVERVIANIKFDRQEGFRISNGLTARVCGGDVSGSFKFKPNGSAGSYELSLDFYDVNVNEFVTADNDDVFGGQFTLDGRASGQVYFKGVQGDDLSRFGRFGLDIKNIRVADKTITDKILDAILDRSSAHTMQRLQVDGYVRQDKVLIEEVSMLLPLMTMKGSGQIEMPTRSINLLLTAQGLGADVRNPFSDLSFFKAIGKTIAKVEVTGDIMDPKVQVTTLGLLKR